LFLLFLLLLFVERPLAISRAVPPLIWPALLLSKLVLKNPRIVPGWPNAHNQFKNSRVSPGERTICHNLGDIVLLWDCSTYYTTQKNGKQLA